MIILDTNVLSAFMLKAPVSAVQSWLDGQETAELHTTAITIYELTYGIERLPAGQKRKRLADLLESVILSEFTNRIMAFDAEAARLAAKLRADRLRQGFNDDLLDLHIAAITLHHNATLATRNTRDFEHLPIRLVNPWNS